VTKKKDAMIAAALEDLTGTVDLVAFPRVYEKTRDVWLADRVVLVKGKLDVREERYQIVVDEIEPFDVDAEDEARAAARVASPPTVAVPANGGEASPRPTANAVAPDVAVTVRVASSREASNGNGSNGSGSNGHGANGHGGNGAADSNGHGT